MNEENSKDQIGLSVVENVFRFRNQAICIKSNIQVLKDIWELQPFFKEKRTGMFYQIIQENCIFRVVLETYKMFYDSLNNSETINKMAKDVYNEMVQMDEFCDQQQELLDKKRKLSSDLKQYKNVKNVVIASRNKVYAHNDKEYHWFTEEYIEKWGMTDQIYDDILMMANVCIDYCNEVLKMFGQKSVCGYSNHDDVKRLFGLKTEQDEEKEFLEQFL